MRNETVNRSIMYESKWLHSGCNRIYRAWLSLLINNMKIVKRAFSTRCPDGGSPNRGWFIFGQSIRKATVCVLDGEVGRIYPYPIHLGGASNPQISWHWRCNWTTTHLGFESNSHESGRPLIGSSCDTHRWWTRRKERNKRQERKKWNVKNLNERNEHTFIDQSKSIHAKGNDRDDGAAMITLRPEPVGASMTTTVLNPHWYANAYP